MPRRNCSVWGCLDRESTRFSFPNPHKHPKVFQKWLVIDPKLRDLDPDEVFRTKTVCKRHFLKECISPRGRLYTTAIPALFIPEPIEKVCADHSYSIGESIRTCAKQCNKNVFDHNYCIKGKSIEKACVMDSKAVPSTSGVFPETSSTSELDCSISNQKRTDFGSQTTTQFKMIANSRKYKKHALVGKTTAAAITRHEEFRKIRKHLSKLKGRHLNLRQRLKLASNTASMTFFKEMGRWNPIVSTFFKSQQRNFNKHKLGRRFSLEDKIFALALYKRSGKGYRFLSNIFALDNRKTIMTLLNKVKLDPGLNTSIISLLQKSAKKLKEDEKYCILMFDEMAVKPGLFWNSSKDLVEGFEDMGGIRNSKIAHHVFKNWKQPIYYSYAESSTKTPNVIRAIKDITEAVLGTGLLVIAIVCDQGSNNVTAINTLINETKASYLKDEKDIPEGNFISVNGHMIVCLFDPPHLLKGIRNNFLEKDCSRLILYYLGNGYFHMYCFTIGCLLRERGDDGKK